MYLLNAVMDILTCTFRESEISVKLFSSAEKAALAAAVFSICVMLKKSTWGSLIKSPVQGPVCGFKGTAAHRCCMQQAEGKQACSRALEQQGITAVHANLSQLNVTWRPSLFLCHSAVRGSGAVHTVCNPFTMGISTGSFKNHQTNYKTPKQNINNNEVFEWIWFLSEKLWLFFFPEIHCDCCSKKKSLTSYIHRCSISGNKWWLTPLS